MVFLPRGISAAPAAWSSKKAVCKTPIWKIAGRVGPVTEAGPLILQAHFCERLGAGFGGENA